MFKPIYTHSLNLGAKITLTRLLECVGSSGYPPGILDSLQDLRSQFCSLNYHDCQSARVSCWDDSTPDPPGLQLRDMSFSSCAGPISSRQ